VFVRPLPAPPWLASMVTVADWAQVETTRAETSRDVFKNMLLDVVRILLSARSGFHRYELLYYKSQEECKVKQRNEVLRQGLGKAGGEQVVSLKHTLYTRVRPRRLLARELCDVSFSLSFLLPRRFSQPCVAVADDDVGVNQK